MYNNKSQQTRDYLRCITVPRRKLKEKNWLKRIRRHYLHHQKHLKLKIKTNC